MQVGTRNRVVMTQMSEKLEAEGSDIAGREMGACGMELHKIHPVAHMGATITT